MKRILFLFLLLINCCLAVAQTGSLSQSVYKTRVNDTISVAFQNALTSAIASGYGYHFWNNQAATPHWDFYTSSGSIQHIFEFGAGGGAGTVTDVLGTTNRITSTGGATPVINISATFEALLGKVAQRIDQNNASTTSAQLATTLSDESGTTGGFTRADYVDAKVADAVNNGTTTIAPSQNAVFDLICPEQTANATTSTAGGTITLDFSQGGCTKKKVKFKGSAPFSTDRNLALTNDGVAEDFEFEFEMTNAVDIVFPTGGVWGAADDSWDEDRWTAPQIGVYLMVATFDDISNRWRYTVAGPLTFKP